MARKGTLFGKPRESVIKHPGALTAQAKAAGMSLSAFIKKSLAKGSEASAKTKKRAVLARTFRMWAKRR